MKKMPINSNMNKSSNNFQNSNNTTNNTTNTNTRRRSDELTINEKKKTDLLLEASTTNVNNLMNRNNNNNQIDMDDDIEIKTNNVRLVDLNLMSDLSDESSSSSSLSSPPPPLFLLENEQQLNSKLKTTTTTANHNNNNNNSNNNKKMQQQQFLDNTAIQHLVDDQIKSHLIIDDQENLKVKSAAEFMSLFKTNSNILMPTMSDSSSAYNSLEVNNQSSLSSLSLSSSSSSQNNIEDKLVKCIAIFGNTGDGKSHTLNNTFFNGRNIFCTSQKQETCTVGVWCAYDSNTNSLIFDTEGLLGTTTNDNKRMRLLLKVLAICDVIIYRTRAERLHNDLFEFLSNSSVAYLKYFKEELKIAAGKLKLETISTLGPCCVIFHETQHTDILTDIKDSSTGIRTVSHQINDRFAKLDLNYEAFSSIEYVGTRTSFDSGQPIKTTDFTKLARTVKELLRNNSVRSPRKLSSIYQLLKVLNDKFNGIINKTQLSTFADEYFTCSAMCLSCGKRCQNSINHFKDSILHSNSDKCHYDHQYDNKVYVCKQCHEAGREVVVIPKTSATTDNSFVGIVKYTCSGYVLECPHHGIIYRSRQYWYGNPEPESVVRTELKHIWSGQLNNVGTSHNLSRKIIDNVSYIGESLQNVSAKPTMIAKQWMADQVAPSYWIPNSEIIKCFKCEKSFTDLFEKKHHCRGCGKGFCDKCSSKRMIISWWSTSEKVRVCDICFDKKIIPEPKPNIQNSNSGQSIYMKNSNSNNSISNSTNSLGILNSIGGNNELYARKVTETVQGTIGLIGYATKLPFDVIKESARPSYWKPDSECIKCALCKKDFDDIILLHHCRSCGDGVCHNCSPHLRPVISRGWETPVRVCNNCLQNEISS